MHSFASSIQNFIAKIHYAIYTGLNHFYSIRKEEASSRQLLSIKPRWPSPQALFILQEGVGCIAWYLKHPQNGEVPSELGQIFPWYCPL